jgi:hypothetical protein
MRPALALIAILAFSSVKAVAATEAVVDDATVSAVDAKAYFPADILNAKGRCGPIINSFEMAWYPKVWRAAEEQPLLTAAGPRGGRAYRFTWLRSFHPPVTVRIEQRTSGQYWMAAKLLSGPGGNSPAKIVRQTERPMSSSEVQSFQALLLKTHAMSLAQGECRFGKDGAQWLFEGVEDGRSAFASRWTPKGEPMRDLGLGFLELTGFPLDPIY